MTIEKVQEVIDWHVTDDQGNEYSVEQMRDYGTLEFQYTVWDDYSGLQLQPSNPKYIEILNAIENFE